MSYNDKKYMQKLVADYDEYDDIHDHPFQYWNVILAAKEQRGEGEDSLTWVGLARSEEEAAVAALTWYKKDYNPMILVQVYDENWNHYDV